MRKRKLTTLSMMLLASLCFSTACSKSSVTETNVIATVNGTKITAENIYSDMLYNENTAKYLYEKLERALIQSAVPATKSMRTKVENEVERWRRQIEENAALNGSVYKDDLQSALETAGASSIEEYIENKIYALQKEYAREQFIDANRELYTKAFIDANYLYDVSDIVISISNSSTTTDLYNITISSGEAKKIYDVFTELVNGEKYYNIASYYSSGKTASSGGSLGIVTLNDSSITNELRYALIGYSSIIEGKYNDFNLPNTAYSTALKDLYNSGLQTIPYSYIKSLNDVEPSTSNSETKYHESTSSYYYSAGGNTVSSSSKVYYRNIIFNNLLNTKTPKFISVTQEEVDAGAKAIKIDNALLPNVNEAGYSSVKTSEYILTNDLGNPYVVFKDADGLHVTSIQKTPFASDIYDYYSNVEKDDEYSSYIELGNNPEERLEAVEALADRYVTKDYGSNVANEELVGFAMFNYYLDKPDNGGFKITDETVKSLINQYINSKSSLADLKVTTDFEGYYKTYSNLVWLRQQSYIVKEVPLLSCLVKNEKGNWSCIYKYGEGFKDNGGAGQ